MTESTEEAVRQDKRGRPGKDTRYVKSTKTRYALDVQVDADQVRRDAASDGCFPLISNDQQLTDTQVLTAYRYQPNLEKRHHQLKSVQDAAPVTSRAPPASKRCSPATSSRCSATASSNANYAPR